MDGYTVRPHTINKIWVNKLIVVSVGATILINVRDTSTDYNTPWNLSDQAATGLAEYGNWFKIIVIVGVAAVVLSLIFMAFGRRGGGATY